MLLHWIPCSKCILWVLTHKIHLDGAQMHDVAAGAPTVSPINALCFLIFLPINALCFLIVCTVFPCNFALHFVHTPSVGADGAQMHDLAAGAPAVRPINMFELYFLIFFALHFVHTNR